MAKHASTPENAIRACQAEYRLQACQCRRRGLDADKIEESATAFCERCGDAYYVTADACRPTGVALGCPLPDPIFAERLSRVAKRFAGRLREIRPETDKLFAFVRRDVYHVTVTNRSHFDDSGVLQAMSLDEATRVSAALARAGYGCLSIDFHGLLLTRQGRLLAMGFPTDDRFFELRRLCCDVVPELRTNLPLTAHIKLGHVLAPLAGRELERTLCIAARCGEFVSARVTFRRSYTPVKRLDL